MVSKKGAMELSIGTIVILVIAMTMLILGIVLVRTVFTGATDSADELNNQVMNEIKNLFTDESKDILVRLGSDKSAKVKAGTENFGVHIAARTEEGSAATADLKYILTLDESARENCISILSKGEVKEFFEQKIGEELEFTDANDNVAGVRIGISVPDTTPKCTQKVIIEVKDGSDSLGKESFTIQVLKKGFF